MYLEGSDNKIPMSLSEKRGTRQQKKRMERTMSKKQE